ncbi:iron ABC transporter permease [Archaeoglobales archaeon]|nr:MAG: iron ABC transporter permease [Archaeoglobales archaeon]
MIGFSATKLFLILIIADILALIAGLGIGSSGVGLSDLLMPRSAVVSQIILDYRLPRTLISMIVGAGLAAAGCSLQALFRNPLADPYILGVSSGASVGAAFVILLGIASTINIMVSAFGFAIITSWIVYRIGRTEEGVPVYTLLLAGVAMAAFLSGITSLLIYISAQDMYQVVFWIMGGFWTANWLKVEVVIFPVVFSSVYLILSSWNLNAILMGEEHAMSVGIDVESFKRKVIAATALLTSAAVSVSGVIGFVGLITPHAMRLIAGENNKIILPASLLAGAAFMPFVDLISRTATSGEVPVGIITALLGAPFFLYLLRRSKVAA